MIRTSLHRWLAAISPVVAALLVMIVGVSPAHANAGFSTPSGVAVDRQGNIFVADTGNGRVVELSPTGRVLTTWQATCDHSSDGKPTGLAVDRLGNVYVTDAALNCVLKYSSRGRLLGQFGTSGDGEFMSPQAVAVGGRGNVFVANTDKHSIEKLSPSGYILDTWATYSSNSGVPVAPQGIAVDATGNIYTVVNDPSANSSAIQKRDPNGELLAEWNPASSLGGIAVGGRGNAFVGDIENGQIIKLSPDGRSLAYLDARDVVSPYAIAVDRRGNLYVADGDNNVIVKVSSTGRELAAWR
jgi:DNA-binding beta-propeller fold protein YncE